jgi:hypothetical protein
LSVPNPTVARRCGLIAAVRTDGLNVYFESDLAPLGFDVDRAVPCSGGDRGGRTAATLYSVVASCNRPHVDPCAYLKDVLQRLPEHPADRLGEFLPDVWMTANPDARRNASW